MVLHLHNACLNSFSISCIFSGGTIIFLAFLKFISDTGFGFKIFLAILFTINSPVASAILWTTSLEAAFGASGPGF